MSTAWPMLGWTCCDPFKWLKYGEYEKDNYLRTPLIVLNTCLLVRDRDWKTKSNLHTLSSSISSEVLPHASRPIFGTSCSPIQIAWSSGWCLPLHRSLLRRYQSRLKEMPSVIFCTLASVCSGKLSEREPLEIISVSFDLFHFDFLNIVNQFGNVTGQGTERQSGK